MLKKNTHYLQIALNSNLFHAYQIIHSLPISERIIIEAGTPLIKEYGSDAIRKIYQWWKERVEFHGIKPYIIADLKTMDRGEREVFIAKNAGASACVTLGLAPVETINSFIETCEKFNIDSMIDMMNVDKPYQILRKLKKLPQVVILHRGVDEEKFSNKPLPIHMINKIKGAFPVMLSLAGGDKLREIQSAVFNGADIVVVWKDFYHASEKTITIANEFLQTIK